MRTLLAKPADTALTAAMLVALLTIYYNSTGARSPNDGSHWSLKQALVHDHSVSVDRHWQGTQMIDYAIRDGHYYSDRAPGTALLGALFEFLGVWAKVLPALAGVVTVFFTYLLARRWTGPWAAVVTAVAVAFGTLLWRYSQLFFSHAPAAALVVAAVYGTLRAADDRRPRWPLLLGTGFATGYAMVTEYELALLTPVLGAYLIARRAALHRHDWTAAWPALIGWGAAMGIYGWYHWTAFGSPFTTAYAFRPDWSTATALHGNVIEGLLGLLGGSGEWAPGLLTLSPVLYLALWGFALSLRRDFVPEVVLCGGVFVVVLVGVAIHPSWYGGATTDTRYLLPVVPLAMLPLAVWVDRYLDPPRPAVWRLLYEGLFYFLLLFSIGFNCHGLFYRYHYATDGPVPFTILNSFDPVLVMSGLLAGVQFDRVFWWFLALGAGLALGSRLALRRRSR